MAPRTNKVPITRSTLSLRRTYESQTLKMTFGWTTAWDTEPEIGKKNPIIIITLLYVVFIFFFVSESVVSVLEYDEYEEEFCAYKTFVV